MPRFASGHPFLPPFSAKNYPVCPHPVAMLVSKAATKGCEEMSLIEELYSETFPEEEKVPFRNLLRTEGRGGRMLSFSDGGAFAGFAYMFSSGDLTFLVYLAVLPECRGKGYGAQAVDIIRRSSEGRVFSVMEKPDCGFSDPAACARRRRFYERNGCTVPGIDLVSDGYVFDAIFLGEPIPADEMQDAVCFYESVHNGKC